LKIEVRQGNNKDEQMQNLEKALKVLKRKLEKDGIMQIIKERRYFTKKSALEHARIAKIERKRELERRHKK
jgi:ribosomal protein S21